MRAGLPLTIALLLVATGCARQAPDAVARERGLMPATVDITRDLPEAPPDPNSPLGIQLRLLANYPEPVVPQLPPMPRIDRVQSGAVSYTGWKTEVIDASSFDALTNSLNGIMQRMPPDLAMDFDRLVKYVLLQVTKDPLIAKKAATSQPVSDAELLRLVQNYLDGRTPEDVLLMAQQINARENPGAQPPAPSLPVVPLEPPSF
jgi:hypothetical protein